MDGGPCARCGSRLGLPDIGKDKYLDLNQCQLTLK